MGTTSKWCNDNLNAAPMTWNHFKGELIELLTARDWKNFKEEISDVMYAFYCSLHTRTGISLPMIGAGNIIEKILIRLLVWIQIFNENGLVFDKKYLINGSNHQKESKVKLALDLARKDQLTNYTN